jgi:O-antigen biosynthesis protein
VSKSEIENKIESGDYSEYFNENVFNEISTDSLCLDVGCWVGDLGKQLIDKKRCRVDGIDFREDVLERAKSAGYENAFEINFNNSTFDVSKINRKYDFIIFADVLEHFIYPQGVLETLKKYLKPKGKIVVSLPNVAFVINRLQLLLGKWEYKEFGTLDKTHLRFYTINSGTRLIKSADFKVEKVKPYNQFGVTRYLKPIDKFFPNLLCYQFLMVAAHE